MKEVIIEHIGFSLVWRRINKTSCPLILFVSRKKEAKNEGNRGQLRVLCTWEKVKIVILKSDELN